MHALSLDQVTVSFDDGAQRRSVLDRLSFQLEEAAIGCLLGASGSGKTTVLRAIAGFQAIDHGEIYIKKQLVSRHGKTLAPERRQVGIVFQDYALFPHLSVLQNITFGLRKHSKESATTQALELLELVGLEGFEHRFPHELSGGQQQRVALARAPAPRPHLLLLDEPFSNLDPALRERLAMDLRDLLKRHGTTALLVTHDQHEAFALADSVGVMSAGRVEQWDTAWRLYHQPRSRRVANFVGQGSFLHAQMIQRNGKSLLQTELGELWIQDPADLAMAASSSDAQGRLMVLLRPDDVVHDDASTITGEIVRKAFRGAQFLYALRLASGSEVL
ncbi:MAG: ABC transporter ATP-binding protein, partial [Betaproteobacteria bacterium]|nr:ABC transporter ATP-binding protein [Betaproteobacteria bacterium]